MKLKKKEANDCAQSQLQKGKTFLVGSFLSFMWLLHHPSLKYHTSARGEGKAASASLQVCFWDLALQIIQGFTEACLCAGVQVWEQLDRGAEMGRILCCHSPFPATSMLLGDSGGQQARVPFAQRAAGWKSLPVKEI